MYLGRYWLEVVSDMTYSPGTTLLHTMQDGSFAVLFLLILPFSGMTLCQFLSKIKTVSFTVVSHMQLWNSPITLFEWGLGPHHRTCRWICTVVIRFILSYCVRITIRAALNKTNRTKRERVQAIALRTMIGILPSIPSRAWDRITHHHHVPQGRGC